METKIHIADRVRYEAWGTKVAPHSPAWGNEVLGAENGELDHFVRSGEESAKLAELKENKVLENLAKRWSTSGNSIIKDRRWASYATSGSETNGKEALQLLGLVQEVHKYYPDNAAGIYFIDTASHSMKDQLKTEAKMYSVASGVSEKDINASYLNLFENRIDQEYIEDFIDRIGASPEEAQQIRTKWQERSIEFDVPADAIFLPDQDKYINFCSKVGMHEEILSAINNAFEFVKSREDIPQTLGSLRCAIFTETSALLAKKLGLESPIIAAPFDEAAVSTGWGSLTMQQIQEFAAETFTGKVAYYNVLDPNTGAEIPQYNRTNGRVKPYKVIQAEMFLNTSSKDSQQDLEQKQKWEKILSDYNKSRNKQNSMSDPRYADIIYKEMMKHGHFSGMGYYNFLMTRGMGSMAFVFDNYEAGGPHERTVQAETEGRFGSDVVMVGYPRGWARIASFEGDENSTYGASPPLELLASELLKDPNGIDKLSKYTNLLNQSIGKNTTIALDASASGSTLYVVPDNRTLATADESSPISVINTDYQNVQIQIDAMLKFIQNPSEKTYKQIAEIGLVEQSLSISEYLTKKQKLSEIIGYLEEKSKEFAEKYKDQIKRYHLNRQKAVSIAFYELGGSFFKDQAGNRTLPGVSDGDPYLLQLSDSVSLEQVDATAEIMYLRARQSIELSQENKRITEDSLLYAQYKKVTIAMEKAIQYKNAETIKKIVSSLVKAASGNKDRFVEAVRFQKDNKRTNDPAVSNLVSSIQQLVDLGHETAVSNLVNNPDILNCIFQEASNVIEENANYLVNQCGCDKQDEKILKKGESDRILKLISGIRKTIESFSGTQYEADLSARISSLPDSYSISDLNKLCLTFCAEKAPEISDIMRGKSEDSQRLRFNVPEDALAYVQRFVQVCEKINRFKDEVKRIWTVRNSSDPMVLEYLEAHNNYKISLARYITLRNECEAQLDTLNPKVNAYINETLTKMKKTVIVVQ